MALNINSDRAETAKARAPAEQLYLYNSDRISHLMGSGLLTFSFRVNQLMELFEEEREMVFADEPEEMREAAARFKRDDAAPPPDRRGGLAEVARASQRAPGRALSSRRSRSAGRSRSLCLADGAMVMRAAPAAPAERSASSSRSARRSALNKSGAIALCSRDFAAHSRFSDAITIFGAAECEYPDVRYQRLVDWRRWWLRDRTAYAAP